MWNKRKRLESGISEKEEDGREINEHIWRKE